MSYLAETSPIQNYVHNVDTDNFTKQVVSITVVGYNGTEVTYTPAANASKVVYECHFQTSWDPDPYANYHSVRLQYSTNGGSSWTDIPGTQMTEGNWSGAQDYLWYQFSYVHILDTWSGERKLRLAGKTVDTYNEFTIGRSYNTIPSSGEGPPACPHVSIYSVMP